MICRSRRLRWTASSCAMLAPIGSRAGETGSKVAAATKVAYARKIAMGAPFTLHQRGWTHAVLVSWADRLVRKAGRARCCDRPFRPALPQPSDRQQRGGNQRQYETCQPECRRTDAVQQRPADRREHQAKAVREAICRLVPP